MYIDNTNCKPSLLLNNVCLAAVNEVNDLSVVIDYRLTFLTQISKNFVRASVSAFKVYVRPILE